MNDKKKKRAAAKAAREEKQGKAVMKGLMIGMFILALLGLIWVANS